jgi:Ser/Thr protein kinase RdoA (MazF antagonist)
MWISTASKPAWRARRALLREVAYHLLHVSLVHRLLEEHATHQADLVEAAAGRQWTLGRTFADKGKAAAVGDLRAGQATGFMHAIGQGLEMRQAGLGQGHWLGKVRPSLLTAQ